MFLRKKIIKDPLNLIHLQDKKGKKSSKMRKLKKGEEDLKTTTGAMKRIKGTLILYSLMLIGSNSNTMKEQNLK